MRKLLIVIAGVAVVLATGALPRVRAAAQATPAADLIAGLKNGGYVLVMRHASSPREVPDRQTANAGNVKMERQLDAAGRSGSMAMGQALRALKIPVGEVLSSPTYRALETVRLAQLPNVQTREELGDGGQSMQDVAEKQAAWLRERAMRPTKGTNTIIVTHMPNISRAFPDWGAVADGEAVVVGPDRNNGIGPVGRIKIDEWPSLAPK